MGTAKEKAFQCRLFAILMVLVANDIFDTNFVFKFYSAYINGILI